ncbi:hypothetical protein [Methylobacterium sp. J-070]|uniref:hypothetical protein n=1 Tax=Methylobacterium sp. J-070 TaxID=2836650 RepID=UPI001FB93C71|nr:hypothetical protein [Methylobacterium sp. J-070]MCJ2052005.1 hypothetical protein [Methylobacterium sp. J-070]
MSALSATLSARLAKLLPRLASDQHGEVAATAAAVTRTLKAEGRDWHDLAAHVAEGPREVIRYIERAPRPEPAAYPFGSWRDVGRQPRGNSAHRYLVVRCQNASAGRLSEWEASFLLSIGQRLERGLGLTPKQASTLTTIAERLGVA